MSEEETESASSEGESEEGSSWSGEEDEEVEYEDEPVLKYRRFATKEVVMDITQMAASREYALICCIAVHPKVLLTVCNNYRHPPSTTCSRPTVALPCTQDHSVCTLTFVTIIFEHCQR